MTFQEQKMHNKFITNNLYSSQKKIFNGATPETKTNNEQRNVSNKKNTYTSECVSVSFSLWAQLGLNQ